MQASQELSQALLHSPSQKVMPNSASTWNGRRSNTSASGISHGVHRDAGTLQRYYGQLHDEPELSTRIQ